MTHLIFPLFGSRQKSLEGKMYPRAFEYFAPRSIPEVIDLLRRYGEEARLLAGGQSLIPLMKLRLANPQYVVDIGRLPDLAYVREVDSSLVIGSLTCHADVLESALVRQRFPLMADTVSVVGDAQVRNWGTVGGALAEADPAGDWGPVALALNARIRPSKQAWVSAALSSSPLASSFTR